MRRRGWPIRRSDESGVEMNDKPSIICPHCEEFITASDLASRRKFRNSFGIDVFTCRFCDKELKFEPREYLFVSSQIKSGELSDEVAIHGVKVEEILPSERAVLEHERKHRAPWKSPLKIAVSIIVLLVIAFLLF